MPCLLCRVLKGAGSQSIVSVCINIFWWAKYSKAFYRAAAELCEAAQLCMFILGMGYHGLGVLRCVFGVRYVVAVLVS